MGLFHYRSFVFLLISFVIFKALIKYSAKYLQSPNGVYKNIKLFIEMTSSFFFPGFLVKANSTCKDRITPAKNRTDPLSCDGEEQPKATLPLPFLLSLSPSPFIVHCYFCRCICSDLFFSSHLLMIHALGFLAPSF